MRAALWILALVAAGCAGPAALPAPASPPALAHLPPSAVAFFESCPVNACSEPTAVSLPDRLVATVESGESLAVSRDDGATWSRANSPPLPAQTPPALPVDAPRGNQRVLERADALLQSHHGTLWFSAIVGNAQGVQIASSPDGGESWPVNVFLRGLGGVTDRQWLAFGAGSVVYVSVNQVPLGILLARSDDAGKTWGGFAPVASAASRPGIGGAGAPIVDDAGRIIVPFFGANQADVSLAVSTDRGESFSIERVAPIEGEVGSAWPTLAVAGDHSALAWNDGQARLLLRQDAGPWTPCAVSGPATAQRTRSRLRVF